ncbi:MAG TPA: epoxide hydrolase N-terminal domain-containing protein, partial [Ktedonobacteraceae bacterium]|nr:epoxide hydrolase N-terminal domain-containing protein [Ktedonobacteraceae bacterium]
MSLHPFTIAVPQTTLDDLHRRLARTRWPDEAEDSGWSYGISLAYMQDVADYWQHE